MIINYIKNIITKQPIKIDATIFLKDVIKRLTYISSSISALNIDIIETIDNFGGYLNNKIILPNKINMVIC